MGRKIFSEANYDINALVLPIEEFKLFCDRENGFELREDGKLNFVMYKVKFASGMPLKLDMVVEGADYTEDNGTYTISGDGLIPYAMGGPFEKFTITNLRGTITSESCTLDFICGEYPVSYNGNR